MKCPKIEHNYKKFLSQVLPAAGDGKYKFTFIDVGQDGSTNESSVLKNSELAKRLESYLLNAPLADIAEEKYFKDRESFVLLYLHGRR